LYAHQNEDIVRMTPEQLKQRMAEKERLAAAGGWDYRKFLGSGGDRDW
jgi:hypothetical protein